MSNVKLILRSFENNDDTSYGFEPNKVKEDMVVIAGKAAGICYMPDNYLSIGMEDTVKAVKRAGNNIKSGHISVFDHGHVTFIIECSKMMAMILNSTNLYSTSEKSARYTTMHPETEYERDMYGKWRGIFSKLIRAYYPETIYSDKEVDKLAMENARYMISVFTPTVMEFTVPYSRANQLCNWLKAISDIVADKVFYSSRVYNVLYNRMAKEAEELADNIIAELGLNTEDFIGDHKRIGIELFSDISFVYKTGHSYGESDPVKKEYYGDVYVSNYSASFAELAQAQRHRTIHYSINTEYKCEDECYIPKIIAGTPYEIEWINDFRLLIENDIIPQGYMLNISEEGRIEDFILKSKERMCNRAQYEIMNITNTQINKFYENIDNLSYNNQELLKACTANCNRCKYENYTCKEPCKLANNPIENRLV